jgi:hypothetical protein
MPPRRLTHSPSSIVLYAGLAVVLAVFGVRAAYLPVAYYALAVLPFSGLCLAAWKLGVRALRAEAEERRILAAAGGLLVLAFALFAGLAGFGTPWQATAAENQLRYLVLLVAALLVAAGLILLRQALRDAGERLYSTLGLAAILLASPLYVVFTAVQLGSYRALERGGSGPQAPGMPMLDELSLILLFFGVLLTYLAVAAFATALGRIGWLGRTASRAFLGTSLLAALCVGIRMAEAFASPKNPLWGFKAWYSMPGFVLAIPAVPWILSYLLGVTMLRRAGEEQS